MIERAVKSRDLGVVKKGGHFFFLLVLVTFVSEVRRYRLDETSSYRSRHTEAVIRRIRVTDAVTHTQDYCQA